MFAPEPSTRVVSLWVSRFVRSSAKWLTRTLVGGGVAGAVGSKLSSGADSSHGGAGFGPNAAINRIWAPEDNCLKRISSSYSCLSGSICAYIRTPVMEQTRNAIPRIENATLVRKVI